MSKEDEQILKDLNENVDLATQVREDFLDKMLLKYSKFKDRDRMYFENGRVEKFESVRRNKDNPRHLELTYYYMRTGNHDYPLGEEPIKDQLYTKQELIERLTSHLESLKR